MLLTFIKLPFVIKISVMSIRVAVLHRFYCIQCIFAESLYFHIIHPVCQFSQV